MSRGHQTITAIVARTTDNKNRTRHIGISLLDGRGNTQSSQFHQLFHFKLVVIEQRHVHRNRLLLSVKGITFQFGIHIDKHNGKDLR